MPPVLLCSIRSYQSTGYLCYFHIFVHLSFYKSICIFDVASLSIISAQSKFLITLTFYPYVKKYVTFINISKHFKHHSPSLPIKCKTRILKEPGLLIYVYKLALWQSPFLLLVDFSCSMSIWISFRRLKMKSIRCSFLFFNFDKLLPTVHTQYIDILCCSERVTA